MLVFMMISFWLMLEQIRTQIHITIIFWKDIMNFSNSLSVWASVSRWYWFKFVLYFNYSLVLCLLFLVWIQLIAFLWKTSFVDYLLNQSTKGWLMTIIRISIMKLRNSQKWSNIGSFYIYILCSVFVIFLV